jgi:hypothetical protein
MSADHSEILAALQSDELMEQLAAIEHERWSDWQRHVHSQCDIGADGSLTIPAALAARWNDQISREYALLSEVEKESDREQVRRYLTTLATALRLSPPAD